MKQIYFSLFLLTSVVGFSQTTAIPDANFEQALIDQEIDSDATINGEVLTADIAEITTVNVLNLAISDLTGIEDFTALRNLNVSGNLLTSLDLSQNTALRTINASNNQLTSLNIQNGNNGDLEAFVALGNPDLSCIQLDNPGFGEQNLTDFVDEGVSFSTDCSDASGAPSTTTIPDAAFEQALIDLEIDSDGIINGQAPTADLFGVTTLSLFGLGISDLTGIEDFSSLTTLRVEENQLTSLDVSQNTALVTLAAEGNQLTSLDLSQNADVIRFVNVQGNQLASLDVSQNTRLLDLNVADNQLTSLNIQNGNNEGLEGFLATGNPDLSCIQVDNFGAATVSFSTFIDEGASFSVDCEEEEVELSTEDFELRDVMLFPNPTSSVLNITIPSNIALERINIYNSVGQSVGSTEQTVISVSDLSDGIYFLEIITDKGLTTSRFIKN